jgi:hypothetical protein
MESEFRYRLLREAFVAHQEPPSTAHHAVNVHAAEPGLTRQIDRRGRDPRLAEAQPRRTGDAEERADARTGEQIRTLRDAVLVADGVRDRLMARLADAVHDATASRAGNKSSMAQPKKAANL